MTDLDDDSVGEVSAQDDDNDDREDPEDRGAFTPITSGVGFNLLKRMGWSEGKGCGVQEQGRSNPVWTSQKSDSDGLCEMCRLGDCEIHGRKVSAMALAISLLPARKSKQEEEYVHHVKLANKKITEAVKNKSSSAEMEFEVGGKPQTRRTRLAVKLQPKEVVKVEEPVKAHEEVIVLDDASNDPNFDLYDNLTLTPPSNKRSADEDDLYIADEPTKKSRSESSPTGPSLDELYLAAKRSRPGYNLPEQPPLNVHINSNNYVRAHSSRPPGPSSPLLPTPTSTSIDYDALSNLLTSIDPADFAFANSDNGEILDLAKAVLPEDAPLGATGEVLNPAHDQPSGAATDELDLSSVDLTALLQMVSPTSLNST